jgi:drug/metabolite transporter (DMT)-like permease
MAGLVLATGLVGVSSAHGEPGAGPTSDLAWGVAACLVGAICTAAVTVIARRLNAVQSLPAGVLAWWQCAVGAATLWLFPLQQGWPAPGAAWAWLAGLGLVHTGLAYSLMYAGMARLRSERIAALQFAYPAVAIVVDALYFGHLMSAPQCLGVGLIAAALWVAERPGTRRHPRGDGRGRAERLGKLGRLVAGFGAARPTATSCSRSSTGRTFTTKVSASPSTPRRDEQPVHP